MVRWHHRLEAHEFEQTPGVGDGQGGLRCCSPWGHKESDITDQLNLTYKSFFQAMVFLSFFNSLLEIKRFKFFTLFIGLQSIVTTYDFMICPI